MTHSVYYAQHTYSILEIISRIAIILHENYVFQQDVCNCFLKIVVRYLHNQVTHVGYLIVPTL